MPDPLINITSVGKRFSKNQILKDVNLSIFQGEVLGIIGPNGGGKSTLLKLLAGLFSPTEGSIIFSNGSDSATGLVLAEPGFYPLLSGWENLLYFGALLGLDEQEIKERAQPLLAKLGLDEMNERVSVLSTGTRQKLSLLRALIIEPKTLLLDEPTANLDPIASQIFFDEIRDRANAGLACVWVTHQLDAAESICDRVIFVDQTILEEVSISKSETEKGKLFNIWKSFESNKARKK